MKMHHFILGLDAWTLVDHKNRDTLDNRRENLRVATTSQNGANQSKRPGGSSRFKGVCWDKSRGKWKARIMLNYKNVHIGRFLVEEDAARAHDVRAREVWGEFAVLNFPM